MAVIGGGSQKWNHKLNGIYNSTLSVICTLYSEELVGARFATKCRSIRKGLCVYYIYHALDYLVIVDTLCGNV